MNLKIILAALLMCGVATQLAAQHPDHYGDIRLGPVLTGGASANAGDVANGTKTSPLCSGMGGVNADIPMSDNMALDLTAAYDLRAINFHLQDNSAVGVDYLYGYLAFRPAIRFNNFFFGLGMGLPVNANTIESGGAAKPDVSASDMNLLYEARIGGRMQIADFTSGSLYLTLDGSYAFNRILTDSYFKGGDETKNNGPIATAQLGVVYLFDIVKHAEPFEVAEK